MLNDYLALRNRSASSTGGDLVLEPLGDITITDYGDLKVQSGHQLVEEALLRRLQTPFNGYSRVVLTPDGLTEIGSGYGNSVYSYLSSPLTSNTLSLVREAVEEAARKDERIEVQYTDASTDNQSDISIEIVYRIKGESELFTLRTNLNRNVSA